MKAIIPAAGLGTRLRPLTYTRPKPVLRVANKPIIVHAIDNLVRAGIHDIGIIVSELTRASIEAAVNGTPGVNITYIDQNETLGLGHAVLMGRDFVGSDDFCVYLGDNLFEHGITRYLEVFREQQADAVIALVEVENPSAFGVAVLDEEGRITRLMEKPKVPPSNLAVAGVYCFKAGVMDVLAGLEPSARGEYEITDAIAQLIADGRKVIGERVQGWWKDTGRPFDLIDANRLLLEQIEPSLEGEVEDSRVTGRVVIQPGAVVRGSIIMGPALIGAGAVIENAYVGPFTSVGRDTVIRQAEVEYSVIDEEVEICDVAVRLQECLIGLRAKVTGHAAVPRVHRLTLSDASIVELGS
ncbi:glucose-1-phosphate thymidylyltransferase [Deinobacterium chartae]|uniref:Glucose-1-phosphate thymidylyltransferase n=1 Tax=Deinobacterium chartae TaxID=521158 RepID=A0A841I288_9DEIO|nr:glucose-1-phosphate thymidylyltransferase [Deinobacterium chartae]MBB6099797.1 glucose-1-phosphate thymidylyltransferase [Deinobacterium chartae]